MSKVYGHLNYLGLKVKDKVTGYSGVVTSISFDLYGCIQATINPGITTEGKLGEQFWFDVNRLQVLDDEPVMNRPDYIAGPIAEGKQGPAEKPMQKA